VLGYASDVPARCLSHSFIVHTSYEVAPPYPPFLPHISMVCPGVVVFNTGDSLVAVDIAVDRSESCSVLLSTQLTATDSLCPVHLVSTNDDVADVETLAASESTTLISSSPHSEEQSVPKDATNTPPAETRVFRDRNLSSGKENQRKFSVSAEIAGGSKQLESVYNCENGQALSTRRDESESVDCWESVSDAKPPRSTSVSTSMCTPTCTPTGTPTCTPSLVKLTAGLPQTTCDNLQSSDETEERSTMFELPQLTFVPPRLFDGDNPDSQCSTYSTRRYSSAVTLADVEGKSPTFLLVIVR